MTRQVRGCALFRANGKIVSEKSSCVLDLDLEILDKGYETMNNECWMRYEAYVTEGAHRLCSNRKYSRTDSDRVDWFLQAYSFSASGQLDEFIIGLIHPERDWEIFTWLYREPFGQGMGKIILKNQKQKYIVNIVTLGIGTCVEMMYRKKISVSREKGTQLFSCSTHEMIKRESCWRRAEVNWISVSIEHIEKWGREGESRCMSTL